MTVSSTQFKRILDAVEGRAQTDVPLSRHTSFRIGGPADVLVEPADKQQLVEVLKLIRQETIPMLILGLGTNILAPDEGFRGVAIKTSGLREIDLVENGSNHAKMILGSGAPLPQALTRSARQGWRGLEALWGIPGSFGGAIVTNAGAKTGAIGDLLTEIHIVSRTGEETTLCKGEFTYGYRSMKLPEDAIALGGAIRLEKDDPKAIERDIEEAAKRRRATQPVDQRTAGCVFKNPSADNPAGAIIDRLGLKGRRVGDAQVSEKHANFIVNLGQAKASHVTELIDLIRLKTKASEGIELELEIRILGVKHG